MIDLKTNYGTRLCLSGLESRRLLDTFSDFGIKHIQVSYYYLRRVFSDPLEFVEYTAPFNTVLIDSGTIYQKFKTKEEENSFLGEYVSYLSALDRNSYTAAVYEEGVEMNKLLPEEMLIYPLEILRSTFDNDISSICQNVPYIGVSNKEAQYKGGENLKAIFAAAANTRTYVHLFATSSKNILNRFPVYSANTSSWRSGSRYLNTYIYESPSRGIRIYQPTDKSDKVKTDRELKSLRHRQKAMISARQPALYKKIDWEGVEEGDPWEIDKANLSQWALYSDDLELAAHNKYWLGVNEKENLLDRRKAILGKIDAPASNRDREESISPPSKSAARNIDELEEVPIEGEVVEEDSKTADIEGVDTHDVTKEIEEIPVLEDAKSAIASNTAYISGLLQENPKNKRLRPVDERMKTLRNCDFCILAGRCPKYSAGSPCAFGLPPEDPTYDHTELEQHVMEDAADLLAIQKDRIQQAYLEEKMDASGLSKDLGKEIERYMSIVSMLSEATDKRDELSIKAKGAGILDMFTKSSQTRGH